MKIWVAIGAVTMVGALFLLKEFNPFISGPSAGQIATMMDIPIKDSSCRAAKSAPGYWCRYTSETGSHEFTGRRRFQEMDGRWYAVE
uniref:Uncharacterized protein n=1 Tax=Rhizobium rhizogenes TaxID=359 RepID=A0A7S4ZUG2_RHIRH|nr:hypothetical protein pC6.5d_684 [Rhizobium rhizogenes]